MTHHRESSATDNLSARAFISKLALRRRIYPAKVIDSCADAALIRPAVTAIIFIISSRP